MKRIPCTTPFEDLILGSQFVPILTKLGALKCEEWRDPTEKNVGVFQCKQCKGTFLQEGEALLHYKSHVLTSHEEYFFVSIGGSCPVVGCTLIESKSTTIHFHCRYCAYLGCEILDLPLHMEDQHLSFYKKVSLILSHEDAQLNKVYTCGECNVNIQGKVSIVQHLLTHDTNYNAGRRTTTANMELTNGNPFLPDISSTSSSLVNGSANPDEESYDIKAEVNGTNLSIKKECEGNGENQEQIMININPLDLISSLIEEDLKSDNPLIRTQHFLLGPSDGVKETATYEDYSSETEDTKEETVTQQNETGDIPSISSFDLNAYINSVPAPGVFQCNQCNEAFKYQYLLAAHKKQAHSGQVLTPFKCSVCGNEFTTLADLKRHSAMKHPADLAHFCQVCGHAFSDAVSLGDHLLEHGKSMRKTVVIKTPPVTETLPNCPLEKIMCDGCSEEFPSKAELTRHIVKYQGTCNPNKTNILRCATCREEMPTLEALKEHRRTAHPPPVATIEGGDTTPISNKKGFECDYCGKTFGCRSNLRDHLVVHTGDKPYPCDICGKAFSFLHNMKTHRLTHNEGRNERCPYCDKTYKSKISLYYHMKKGNCRGLSTKEVPEGFMRCTDCLQMFASEDRFEAHKAKGACHVSYRCTHCGLRCKSEEKLDAHLRKGICTLPPGQNTAPKKRRLKVPKSEEPVCCSRCNNYNRDCCCSFTCRLCNKKIFSVGAYILHQKFHRGGDVSEENSKGHKAPGLRKKKQRRPSYMEKKRKKKRRKRGVKEGGIKNTPMESLPGPNPEIEFMESIDLKIQEERNSGSNVSQITEEIPSEKVKFQNEPNGKEIEKDSFPIETASFTMESSSVTVETASVTMETETPDYSAINGHTQNATLSAPSETKTVPLNEPPLVPVKKSVDEIYNIVSDVTDNTSPNFQSLGESNGVVPPH